VKVCLYCAALLAFSLWLCFNLAASFITMIDPSLPAGIKPIHIAIVWAVPVPGSGVALRFGWQALPNPWHRRRVPRLLGRYIYDETFRRDNPDRDNPRPPPPNLFR